MATKSKYIISILIPNIIAILILTLVNFYCYSSVEPIKPIKSIKHQNPIKNLDYSNLKTIPVLHEGRIKPLDSYARILLKSISNKERINNTSALPWLINLVFNPKLDYSNPIFYIHNKDVQLTLGLDKINISEPSRVNHSSSYYSFSEILPGIKQNISLISSLERSKQNKSAFLSPAENQLLDIYHKSLVYFDISRSFSLLIPEFSIKNIQSSLDLDSNQVTQLKNKMNYQNNINYYQVLPYKKVITDKLEKLFKKYASSNNGFTLLEKNQANSPELLELANKFKDTNNDRINTSLKIIPNNNSWLAPWEILESGKGSPTTAKYMTQWQNLIYSYYNQDSGQWLNYSLNLDKAYKSDHKNLENKLYAETIFTKYKFFNKSIIIYFVSLIIAVYSLFRVKSISSTPSKISQNTNKHTQTIKSNKLTRNINLLFFTVALACHIIGLVLRVYILSRPPVSNLYESILFVGIIAGILSLLIELARKDSIGLLLGSIICTILQFIANSYAQSGDTLGVLIAVLDNNFWLGTHVIAITSGYGCCLLLSALAHIYLTKQAFNNNLNTASMQQLQKYILALGLLSLFLTLLGTILGGIWADQSWGRFWGWDPKENGALLICLWLITILHGRISGHLNNLRFIAGCALTSITIMLAWFGVNVLGTGLHSYGFTENIATNLFLFIILELTTVLGLYFFAVKSFQATKLTTKILAK